MSTVPAVIMRGMTVGQLKAILEEVDDETRLLFAVPYGDRSGTQQALPILSAQVRLASEYRESAYSESGIALRKAWQEGNEADAAAAPMTICFLPTVDAV